MKEEVLKKGLSIEELEERAEFAALSLDQAEFATNPNEDQRGMCNACGCAC